MTQSLMSIKVVPHFMRLHEWMALENGYYQDEGLAPDHLEDVTHGLLSHDGKAYYERPQDRPFMEGITMAHAACHWGATSNAGAGMGKFVTDLYGVANYSFFVRPDSPYRSLLDLGNVPIGIGIRAGTHYTTLKAMEMIHPREKIILNNLGGPVKRLHSLESGEIEAVNLVDPAIDMAEQRGMRRLAMGQFRILFWVSENLDRKVLNAYFRVLRRADEELRANPKPYLPLWEKNIPPDMRGDYDYSKFSLGELMVFEPYDKGFFEETHAWLESWGLRDEMKEKDYEKLSIHVSA
ncbi:MAG: hypothetical protein ACE5JS_22200 [Nitrospinota bacterium]